MNLINKKHTKDFLWRSCMLSSIAHAIMMTKYPALSFENSWDKITYNIQDGISIRGSITFFDTYCIGCIREEKSKRLLDIEHNHFSKYFIDMPTKIFELSKEITLQYLLENINDEITPLITCFFWCNKNGMFSNDKEKELYQNGLNILETQLLEEDIHLDRIIEKYDMKSSEIGLLKELFYIKMKNPLESIQITKKQMMSMDLQNSEGIEQAKISFAEIGFILE